MVQRLHVVVLVLLDLAEAEAGAVQDRCVIGAVDDDHVVAADHGGDGALVDQEAGGEDQGGLLADEPRQLLLELDVDVEGSVQEAGAGAAGAVFVDGGLGGLLDLRVVGQAQVVVAPEHDHFLAVDAHGVFLRGLDDPEVGIYPRCLEFLRGCELSNLIE